jgi:hypothetical protein
MSIKGIGIAIGLLWLPIICILSRIYDDPKPQLEYSPAETVTYTVAGPNGGINCIVTQSGFAGTITSCQ